MMSLISGNQQPQPESDWENCKADYIKWATSETTDGRKGRALALSTAKQVLGSVSRIVKHLTESGAHPFLTRAV